MSKIIVHNDSSAPDAIALQMVTAVVKDGRVSGNEGSYCYHTTFHLTHFGDVGVAAIRRNPTTDTFYLVDEPSSIQEVS